MALPAFSSLLFCGEGDHINLSLFSGVKPLRKCRCGSRVDPGTLWKNGVRNPAESAPGQNPFHQVTRRCISEGSLTYSKSVTSVACGGAVLISEFVCADFKLILSSV